MGRIKRIGVMTGGGDCPGLNAAIRAVVNTAALRHGIEVVGIRDGFSGLVEGWIEKIDIPDVSGILSRGGTILGTSNRANPFKYPVVEQKGGMVFQDLSARAAAACGDASLDALVVIGGDGTQSISNRFVEQYGIRVVGIPKTIDNDTGGTDVTIGFDTAAAVAAESIDRIHSTAESHHRVMVIEVMGRYAGWIALHAGLAGGGDVILVPEIPYEIEVITAKINDRLEKGKRFSLVVVAEGAKPKGGAMVVLREVNDPNDPVRLGGISRLVGDQIEDITGIETRYTVLGHVQRGGTPTHFDRVLATRFGYRAVEALAAGRNGVMVGLNGTEVIETPIGEAVAVPRRIDPGSDLVKTAKAMGTCLGV